MPGSFADVNSIQLDSIGDSMFLAVTAHPNPRGLPGSNVLQQLINGAEAWALAIALLGAFVGAALWAVASHGHNHHYAARGRMAALISGARAR
jgi:uncharacterized protein DUF6112